MAGAAGAATGDRGGGGRPGDVPCVGHRRIRRDGERALREEVSGLVDDPGEGLPAGVIVLANATPSTQRRPTRRTCRRSIVPSRNGDWQPIAADYCPVATSGT